ncbi:MAG: hypothetical protein R3B99_19320 [Polyangiales bacterium]
MLAAIHRDFIGAIQAAPRAFVAAARTLRRLAGKALGEHHAADIWDGSDA